MVYDPDHDKKVEKAVVLLALAADPEKSAGPCLTAEEMAALVDGRVKAPASAAYLAHLGGCRKCYGEWLLLKKERDLGMPRRRVYDLHRIKKFSYIGSALAVAASIAVYLNVGDMADKALEPAVSDPALIQDRPVAPAPKKQALEYKEKDRKAGSAEKNVGESAAVPAAPAILKEQITGRLEPVPAPPAGTEQFREQRAKRLAGPAQSQDMVVKEADLAPVERPAAPAASPGEADMTGWLEQLRQACRADRHDPEFWAEMIDRGERLPPSPAEEQRRRMTTLLTLLRGMSDPVSGSRQCRLILVELAKDDGTQ